MSYIGNPYYGSNRKARIYTSQKSATSALKRKGEKGAIYQVGSGSKYVVKIKGKKYYSK